MDELCAIWVSYRVRDCVRVEGWGGCTVDSRRRSKNYWSRPAAEATKRKATESKARAPESKFGRTKRTRCFDLRSNLCKPSCELPFSHAAIPTGFAGQLVPLSPPKLPAAISRCVPSLPNFHRDSAEKTYCCQTSRCQPELK